MMSDAERRREALRTLDASRRYLETATLEEMARELVVQGLDIVAPCDRCRVLLEALHEFTPHEDEAPT